jgi:hypothetical protein
VNTVNALVSTSPMSPSSVNRDATTIAEPGSAGNDDVTALVQTDMDWDDDSPLPPRRPKLFSAATWALAGILVAAGCFTLGARVGRDQATPATATTGRGAAAGAGGAAGARAGGNAGRGGFGAAGAAAGGGGNATFGQVQLVDGNNVYIQDSQGNTIKVTPSPTATITVNAPGTPADFKPGDNVVVQGTADASGNIAAATSIVAAAAGGFGRGGAAAAPGAPGAAAAAGAAPVAGAQSNAAPQTTTPARP